MARLIASAQDTPASHINAKRWRHAVATARERRAMETCRSGCIGSGRGGGGDTAEAILSSRIDYRVNRIPGATIAGAPTYYRSLYEIAMPSFFSIEARTMTVS